MELEDRQEVERAIEKYLNDNTSEDQLTDGDCELLAKGITAMLFGD